MNIILGSGIVGLLAKAILGDDWKVIPFYKSRFFSYNPALDDNFIIADSEIDPFIKQLMGKVPSKFAYNKAWSIQGQLYPAFDEGICEDWLGNIFGTQIPAHSIPYYKNRMSLNVYDIRLNEIYKSLVASYMGELAEESQKGKVVKIEDHKIYREKDVVEYDQIISTIPLDALCKFVNFNVELKSKPIHYIHIETKDLDFEGFNQVMVADKSFSFYKAANIAPSRFLIYCQDELPDPGAYFMAFMKSFDIIDGTSIDGAIPLGDIPSLELIEQQDIFCVGGYAQWDWCADVGSNIKRLVRFANRGNKINKGHNVR